MTFYSLEGMDGVGKTTQAEMLCERLASTGYKVVFTGEPGGTEIGAEIRKLILNDRADTYDKMTEMALFLADQREHHEKVIKPNVIDRKIVISDRYIDSAFVYQGYAKGVPYEFTKNLYDSFGITTYPRITFVLDMHPLKTMLRIKARVERWKKEGNTKALSQTRNDLKPHEFHAKIRAGFKYMKEKEPDRNIIIVNADQERGKIHRHIYNHVRSDWEKIRRQSSMKHRDLFFKTRC